MQRRRSVLGLVGVVSLLGMAAAPSVASAADGPGGPGVEVLVDGLNSPKGLALNANEDLVIGQGAFGPTGPGIPAPALIYDRHGSDEGQVREKTGPLALIDVATSPRDGTGWAISGERHLLHRSVDGTVQDVLDIAAYQVADPDPFDQEQPPFPTESNPYGLTVDRNGDALFTDAANNDLVRVTPAGDATTVARFDLEEVATDHLPDDFPGGPLPPVLTAEAVPTTVGVGPDGALYVGELKGFPFRPGSSRIWRVEPGATGATCSVDADRRSGCRVFSSGYTAVQDIAYDDSTGTLYVYELAADGVLAFEAGFEVGDFPPAVLIAVDARHPRDRHELARGQLSQPGGVVAHGGHVYVTDGVFSDGRLVHVEDH